MVIAIIIMATVSHLLSEITKLELKKKTINYYQNDYQQFSLITSFFF
jgi:hypothetical protein